VFVFNIYRTAFTYFQMGYASAMAYILFFVVLSFTAIQWWLQKRWVHYCWRLRRLHHRRARGAAAWIGGRCSSTSP
jgi:ABC-type Fe3+ transport system permease subunit